MKISPRGAQDFLDQEGMEYREAAKPLPCPFCGGPSVVWKHPMLEEYQIQCAKTLCVMTGETSFTEADAIKKWNTRPQPAPTQGEPDHLREPLIELLAKIEDGPYIGAEGVADAVLELIGRFGAASRPKVEYADISRVIGNMRSRLGAMSQQPDQECNEAADLLERLAAELVKADGVIAFYHDFDHYEGGRSATPDEEKWDNEAMERHAARQQ